MDVDYVVVGGGIMGVAASYYLSKELKNQSKTILLIEQDEIASEKASSNGCSRMYREMYSDPYYSMMMTNALEKWRALEAHACTSLLSPNGLLFFGENNIGETVEGSIEGAQETMKERQLSYQTFNTSSELTKKWPNLKDKDKKLNGIFACNDGAIKATEACYAFANLAEKNGVAFSLGRKLSNIKKTNDQLALTLSDNSTIRTTHLILALGAWTKEFIKLYFDLELDLDIHSVSSIFYQSHKQRFSFPQWFYFSEKTYTEHFQGCHGLYYGFPERAVQNTKNTSIVKIGIDYTPNEPRFRPHSMSSFDYTVHSSIEADINGFMTSQWHSLGKKVNAIASPYTMTRDNDFVLGKLPGHDNIVLFSGGNGRAFKFAPILGKCLSDLTLDLNLEIDISRFDPERLILSSKQKPRKQQSLGKAHVPWGNKGEGIYSKATQGCFDVIQQVLPLAKDAIKVVLDKNQCQFHEKKNIKLFRMCDFGAADGGTSLDFWNQLNQEILSHQDQYEVELTYEDQPNNDWNSLFYYTQGLLSLPENRSSQIKLDSNIYITSSGTSFFKQCVPNNTIDFAFSSTAMHWLSQTQICQTTEAIHHTQLNKNNDYYKVLKEQARSDWAQILTMRAMELKKGAQILIVNFCVSPEGWFLGNTPSASNKMYELLLEIWTDMYSEKVISEEECRLAFIMNYYRNQEEMLAPLLDTSSACYQLGLRYLKHNIIHTPCPFQRAYLADPTIDNAAYAKQFVPTIRTWSNSSFYSALNQSRKDDERNDIVNEFYTRIQNRVATSPENYAMDYVHCLLEIEKT